MSTLARPRIDPLPTSSPSEFSSPAAVKIDVDGLNFYYGERRVLDDIHVKIRPHEVTARTHRPGGRLARIHRGAVARAACRERADAPLGRNDVSCDGQHRPDEGHLTGASISRSQWCFYDVR